MVCLLKASGQVKTIEAVYGQVQDFCKPLKIDGMIDFTSAFSFDEFCHHCVDTVTATFVRQNGDPDPVKHSSMDTNAIYFILLFSK